MYSRAKSELKKHQTFMFDVHAELRVSNDAWLRPWRPSRCGEVDDESHEREFLCLVHRRALAR